MTKCGFVVLALGVVLASRPGAAQAADASAWDEGAHASVRLIAGAPSSNRDAADRAGVEIKLRPGWKTYWRYPGDAGVPPRFDFSQSDNIAEATVLWPAPRSFEEAGSRSIGYKGRVLFPVRVVRKDPSKPARLSLNLEYAVCERICVPAEARLALALDGAPSAHEDDLRASERRLARKASIGEAGRLAVRAVRREKGSPNRIVVDVATSEPATELFAEGPSADWALPIPESVSGAPDGIKRFAFALDGLPPGAAPRGVMLKLTAVSPSDAIEVETGLE